MKPLDLSKKLKNYKSGWVALDKDYKVILHANNFEKLVSKVKDSKKISTIIIVRCRYFARNEDC